MHEERPSTFEQLLNGFAAFKVLSFRKCKFWWSMGRFVQVLRIDENLLQMSTNSRTITVQLTSSAFYFWACRLAVPAVHITRKMASRRAFCSSPQRRSNTKASLCGNQAPLCVLLLPIPHAPCPIPDLFCRFYLFMGYRIPVGLCLFQT